MLEDVLLVGALGHLDQLESHDLYRLLHLLGRQLGLRFVGVAPLRAHKLRESLVVQDVEAQVIVEIEELLFGDVPIGSQWDQTEQLFLDLLFALLLQFEF